MTREPDIVTTIRTFAESFNGRLSAGKLADAVEWLNHNESRLCLEVLGEFLYEEGVGITSAERSRFADLAGATGGETERFDFLDGLVGGLQPES